ncbi:MAG TPA: hypothetical protein PJ986_16485 [Gammaproteobacteria bacterium]|nr:hypothetical protein [Gammaproteobacteria bacterium]
MSTQTKTKTGAEPCTNNEAITSYLDYLATAQEKFAASVKESRERASRVNDSVLDAVLEAQREAIATGKRLAANPQDYAANVKIVIDAATAAQERTLALAKSLYQEQADVAAEFRKLWEGAVKSSNELSEGARKFGTLWPKVA